MDKASQCRGSKRWLVSNPWDLKCVSRTTKDSVPEGQALSAPPCLGNQGFREEFRNLKRLPYWCRAARDCESSHHAATVFVHFLTVLVHFQNFSIWDAGNKIVCELLQPWAPSIALVTKLIDPSAGETGFLCVCLAS